ncbi:MAG: AP2 domain-containing protein [Candidatus Micrarchaeia archaeon]|jgi:hypothetical protein
MKTIPLTQNKFALVDDADYAELSKHKWHVRKIRNKFYAVRAIWNPKGVISFSMHREILGLKKGDRKLVDHRDDNGLNNQRSNIRTCSVSQNAMNKLSNAGSSSKYKGVCWDKWSKKWRASIMIAGKGVFLGNFKTELEAAKTYDDAAREHFGEFAKTNFSIENFTPKSALKN